jgi:hypothetical protein
MEKGDLRIGENTVVHCATEQDSVKVLTIAHKLGYRWDCGEDYLSRNYWKINREETCYNLHSGRHSIFSYYKQSGYEIITAQEFLKLHNMVTKKEIEEYKDFKDGDLVQGLNGSSNTIYELCQIHPKIFAIRDAKKDTAKECFYSLKEIQERFKLYVAPENILPDEPKAIELTLDEIAAKFGLPVSQIKIKK